MDSFMNYWALHGVSLSITRNDSLVYAKGYGKADATTPMAPGTTLRMASVSKLLTAVAVMKLQEEGKVFLDTPVFGPLGVLNKYDSYIRDDNYYLITVEHLLRHQAGFTTRGGDPVFSPYSSRDALLRKQLGRTLAYEPGTWQEYSNFGFLLLSLVIEEVAGMPYEDFLQADVFAPALCSGFRIGGNYLKDRLPGETRYYMQPDAEKTASFDGQYASVEKCYGGNNVTGSAGAGGWTGSTVELARLVACIDGKGPLQDILSEFSVAQMTNYFDPETFGLGWNDCKPDGEWTRSGSFSGTQALIKTYPDGECWVFISNTSAWRGSRFSRDIAGLFTSLRNRFSPLLPRRDLFQE
ncbi:MAG: beta-lactamase family protein [Bacteroidales bacterium]|nr:beta-lactamase family protein [Bacteroidales bacterium]